MRYLLTLLFPITVFAVNANDKFMDTVHSTFECSDKMPTQQIGDSNLYIDGYSNASTTESYKYYLLINRSLMDLLL